ncbi:MAG: ATP-binding cassette domain-containing protein [Roseiarcus sp.]
MSHESSGAAPPALAVNGAVKRFGTISALDEVSISVRRGEVLALLGDNGAGKSTLIKCISGVYALDSGVIEMEGRTANIRSPAEARAAGIETVYQDLALFDNLGPSENFYAGRELSGPSWLPRGLQVMRRREMDGSTSALLDRLKVVLPSFKTSVGLMSGGQRQAVAVARAAAFATKVVILDEPTAALGVRETRQVLDLIEILRDEGHAILLVTHNMEQVIDVADRAVVLRRGRKVGEARPSAETRQQIVSMIVGAI